MCTFLFSNIIKWSVWRTVLLGQFLSVLLCITGITSQLLQSNHGLRIPTGQSFLNYAFLCIIFTSWLALKSGDRGLIAVFKKRGWKYFFLAVIDVEANYLVVKAFQYTSLTSIQLLDCFTIPVVLLLSWICLKVRFGILHVLGVGISLIGVGALVYADIESGPGRENTSNPALQAPNRFLGDMMCISGAALYGVSNVAQEYVVKSQSIVEFLGMIGLFGSFVNGIQFMLLEKQEVANLDLSKWTEVSLLLGYSACLLLLYISMPLVLQISSSTSVNIGLLSADFYSLIIGLIVFQFKYHWLYLLSFLFIILGVVLYNLNPVTSIVDPEYDTEDLSGFTTPFLTGSHLDYHDTNERRYERNLDGQDRRGHDLSSFGRSNGRRVNSGRHKEALERKSRSTDRLTADCPDIQVICKPRNYDTMSNTTLTTNAMTPTIVIDADQMLINQTPTNQAPNIQDIKIITISEKCSQTEGEYDPLS